MGIHRGLNIVRDGLVFGYDTGYGAADNTTATRFYPGKPISNSINGGENRANVVTAPMHGSHGASVTTEIISYGARKNVFRIYSTNTSGYYMVNQQSSIINTSGNVYTYSFDYKKIKGTTSSFSPSAFYKNGYKTPDSGSAASSVTDTIVDLEDGWKRLTRTYTSSYTGYNFYRTNLTTDNTLDFEYLFDNFMVNEGVAVPFVDSTRSSTASLIDLTKTNSIDVSNISFDSTGQPTFDGTDDKINLGNNFDLNDHFSSGGDFSIEAIVKMKESASQNGGIICNQKYSTEPDPAGFGLVIKNSNQYALNLTNNTPTSYQHLLPISFNQNIYHHITYTFKSSTGKVIAYSDGTQYSTVTNSSYSWNIPTDSTRTNIGWNTQGGWGNYINMDIPVVKVYNKVLTPEEVQQNFNAYKNRFNI
tara:strand:- start:8 stop:1261 length:1254 start_codon:yes stop_codon:yes gene_type:complete